MTELSPLAPDFGTRAQLEWERFLRAMSAVEVHAALFGSESAVSALAKSLAPIDSAWQRLREIDLSSPSAEQALTSLSASIAVAEKAILDADATIDTSTFRKSFSESKVPYDTALRYVCLLARHFESAPDRRDRIEFLATRLLSSPAEGRVLMRRREELEAVLAAIAGPRRATEAVRAGAAAFFHEAIQRLYAASSVEEIFASGILLDLRGYKMSLGVDLVDPDVLFATSAMNVEISSRLHFLVGAEGLPPGELTVRYEKLDRQLRAIFRDARSFDVPEAQNFVRPARNAKAAEVWTSPTPKRPARARNRSNLAALFALLVLVLGGGLVAWNAWNSRPPLEALSREQLAAVSPLLETGSVSTGRSRGLFFGRVSSAQWMLLSVSERREAAKKIRDGLSRLGVRTAVVSREDSLAIQIERSRILLVE